MKRLGWIPWVLAIIFAGIIINLTPRLDTARAESTRLRAVNDSLTRVSARIDTVFRVQRDTFYVRRVTTDTAILSVERWKTDTLRVVQFVAQADSTIRSCAALILTCEERVRLRDARIAILNDSLPKAITKEWRGKLRQSQVRSLTIGGAIGALAMVLVLR